VLREIDFLS